jgi:hypothetical protein
MKPVPAALNPTPLRRPACSPDKSIDQSVQIESRGTCRILSLGFEKGLHERVSARDATSRGSHLGRLDQRFKERKASGARRPARMRLGQLIVYSLDCRRRVRRSGTLPAMLCRCTIFVAIHARPQIEPARLQHGANPYRLELGSVQPSGRRDFDAPPVCRPRPGPTLGSNEHRSPANRGSLRSRAPAGAADIRARNPNPPEIPG